MSLCPICGRTIGTYTNDPLLTTPTLSTDEYKGFITLLAQHIKEIQDERHQQEIDNGVTPLTEFSPINIINLFQNIKQYILELRSSTEKILNTVGMSLHDFLSQDENGNIITSKDNWSDPNLEEIKYQCKAIHIEDLRHFISIVGTTLWQEDWSVMKNYEVYVDGIPDGFIPKVWDNNRFNFNTEDLIWQGDKQSDYESALGWKNNHSYYGHQETGAGTFNISNNRWYVALLDSHIQSLSRYTIDVPAHTYPGIWRISVTSQWSFTHSNFIENPNIYLMQSSTLQNRKLITSLNAINNSIIYYDSRAIIRYNIGWIRIKLKFNTIDKLGYGAVRYIYFYVPLGTYSPINGTSEYYVLGVNNINRNLTILFQTAFPDRIDPITIDNVRLYEITCEYYFNFDIDCIYLTGLVDAMGIDVDVAMDVDKIKITD